MARCDCSTLSPLPAAAPPSRSPTATGAPSGRCSPPCSEWSSSHAFHCTTAAARPSARSSWSERLRLEDARAADRDERLVRLAERGGAELELGHGLPLERLRLRGLALAHGADRLGAVGCARGVV